MAAEDHRAAGTAWRRSLRGKKEITDKMLMAVLAKGHVLLEDVPGSW